MAKIQQLYLGAGWRIVGIGVLISIVTSLLFITICSLIMTIKGLPALAVTIASYTILGVSSLLGGAVTGKIVGRHGLQNGAFVGICFLGQAGFIFKTPDHQLIAVDPYLSNCCERYFGFKSLCILRRLSKRYKDQNFLESCVSPLRL